MADVVWTKRRLSNSRRAWCVEQHSLINLRSFLEEHEHFCTCNKMLNSCFFKGGKPLDVMCLLLS